MTNKLLLTTALVSAAFAFSANAADPTEWDGKDLHGVTSGTAARKVSEEPVTANDVTVSDNENTGDGVGGAIYVQVKDGDTAAGELTLNGGTFSGNYSKYDGGAIGNYGDLVVNGTTFTDNKAQFTSKDNGTASTDNKPVGGGAISLGAVSHTHITGSTFDGNKSGKHGGAIGTRHSRDGNLEGAWLTVEDSIFKNNDAKEWGGAIANNFYHDHTGNEESVLLKGNTFTSNTAKYGGALAGLKGSATSVVGGSFVKNGFSATQTGEDVSNVTTEQGGAIITEYPNNNKEAGKLKVSGTTFEGNRAKSGGGAIWSGGETHITGSTFTNNKTLGTNGTVGDDMTGKHEGGGAIFVGSSSNVTIEGSTFESNSSGTAGGAIATRSNSDGKKSGLKISGSQFKENHAEKAGGAISIGSPQEGTDEKHPVEITDTDFSGNTSANGGAIYNKGKISLTGGEFIGNTSTGVGGAITNSGGDLTLTDATFDGNHSTNGGGAIYSNGASGKLTINSGSFTNNSSEKGDGGAIHVATSSEVTIGTEDTSVLFEGNSAGEQGGAISIDATTAKITNTTFRNNSAKNGGAMHIDGNGDKVEFDGDVVFENNTLTDGTKNDINFEKGNGTITVKDGASLSLDGGITVEDTASSGSNGPKLELEKGSTLSVNNETVIQSKVSVSSSGSSSEDARLKLRLAADSDNVFDLKKNIKGFENGSIDNLEVDTTNNLYNIVETEKGVYAASQKSADEVASNLGVKESDAGTILGMMKIKSTNERFTKVQDKLAFIAQDDEVDSKEISRAADALGADAAPVVRTRETMLSNLIFDTANDAMDDNLTNAAVGQSSGDSVFEKAKVWVKGLFNYADKDDTSKSHGFDIDTYGVAMGVDKEIGAGKVGLGYAYSQSDINGYTRDTDVDTHSVFVYGQYQPAEWYVKGVLAYSWSDYEEKKSVLGENANAKYDVDTLALQGLYGYNLHLADGYDVTPEVGLRYMSASQDAYTNGLGVRVNGRDIDVLTAVAGVKAAKTFELSNGLNIRPEVRAALTYDLTADNNDSVVTMGNTLYSVNGEKLDRFGAELGAKLATDITSNWEVSAGYEGRFREDYSDHTGILSAKYKF